MNIKIYSRENMEQLIDYERAWRRNGWTKDKENPFENIAVVSFFDPPEMRGICEDYQPVDYSDVTNRLFQIPLHDINIDILGDYDLTYNSYLPLVNELAEFIYDAKKDGLDIICQCEYGQSRSAGCAAAIREHYYGDGIKIFADYRYYPNQLVFNKVFEALEGLKREMG